MVEIPDDVATLIASYLRRTAEPGRSMHTPDVDAWADLIDPKPPTLREQVAKAWCADYYGEDSGSAKNPAPDQLDAADAVLAVVADWLAAQPLAGSLDSYGIDEQRDHDVRLLRGAS